MASKACSAAAETNEMTDRCVLSELDPQLISPESEIRRVQSMFDKAWDLMQEGGIYFPWDGGRKALVLATTPEDIALLTVFEYDNGKTPVSRVLDITNKTYPGVKDQWVAKFEDGKPIAHFSYFRASLGYDDQDHDFGEYVNRTAAEDVFMPAFFASRASLPGTISVAASLRKNNHVDPILFFNPLLQEALR